MSAIVRHVDLGMLMVTINQRIPTRTKRADVNNSLVQLPKQVVYKDSTTAVRNPPTKTSRLKRTVYIVQHSRVLGAYNCLKISLSHLSQRNLSSVPKSRCLHGHDIEHRLQPRATLIETMYIICSHR